MEDRGHHHTTLHMLAVTWLAFTPSGRSFSLDRLLAIRGAEARGRPWPAERGPLWAVPLLGVQVCVLYLLYLAYFDADEVHRTIDRLAGYRPPVDDQAPRSSISSSRAHPGTASRCAGAAHPR